MLWRFELYEVGLVNLKIIEMGWLFCYHPHATLAKTLWSSLFLIKGSSVYLLVSLFLSLSLCVHVYVCVRAYVRV